MEFILQPWHLLLSILARLINRQQQEVVEDLRTENQVFEGNSRQATDQA